MNWMDCLVSHWRLECMLCCSDQSPNKYGYLGMMLINYPNPQRNQYFGG